MIKIIPLFYILFLPYCLIAQEDSFDMEIRSARETIGDIKYSGFTTSFDLPVGELQKKWWKYSKSIGIVENMKSYYLVKIPPQEKGYASVSLIEKSSGDEKRSSIFLAVLDQTLNDYKEQVRDVLLEFKVRCYTDLVERKIEEKELELANTGKEYQKLVEQSKKTGEKISGKRQTSLLTDISKLSFELEELKRSLNQIQ
ncbi:MAG: hypothetical protein AAFQ94_07370 [Bacteroidota bacterium]